MRITSPVVRASRGLSLKSAAVLLAGSTLLSSLLGLFRDRLLNSMYLDTYKAGIDAYTAAFTVPDFMFFILVSGALSVTFIPVFNQRLAKGNKQSAWELSASVVNLFAIITLVASVLIIIFAEPLVRYVVGPGFDESGRALAVSLMRVLAVNPFLFAIATVVASMQQAIGKFVFFALAPTIYNIGIIIGALVFTNGISIFGWQIFDGGIMGVALGVVLGSIMQLVVSSIGLIGMGFDYRFKIFWKNKGFMKVLRLLPARSLDQGIDYVNGMVEVNLASRLADGSVRAYQQASAMSYVPINLVGVAISTAAFPKMTERLGEGRPDLFKKEFRTVLRVIIWLALPVSAITFFGRGYLISFIKNGGDALMASVLGVLAVAILFRSIYHIAARSFYAQQDTRTPLYISFIAIGLNIVLAVWFTLGLNLGLYGLAWAAAVISVVEVTILFYVMNRRLKGLFNRHFTIAVSKMALATGIMSVFTYWTVTMWPLTIDDRSFFSVFPKFAWIVFLNFAIYLGISYLLRLQEARSIIKKIKSYIPSWKKR